MATWTTISDTVLEPLKPIRSVDGLALRDNPIAIAEGASGAPRVQAAALDAYVKDHILAASGLHQLGKWYREGDGDPWASSTTYTRRGDDMVIFRNITGRSITVQLRVDYNEQFSSGSVEIRLLANGTVINTQSVTGDSSIFHAHSTSATLTQYQVEARATDGGATGQTFFRGFTASITGI